MRRMPCARLLTVERDREWSCLDNPDTRILGTCRRKLRGFPKVFRVADAREGRGCGSTHPQRWNPRLTHWPMKWPRHGYGGHGVPSTNPRSWSWPPPRGSSLCKTLACPCEAIRMPPWHGGTCTPREGQPARGSSIPNGGVFRGRVRPDRRSRLGFGEDAENAVDRMARGIVRSGLSSRTARTVWLALGPFDSPVEFCYDPYH